jgi:uncharacterized protein YjbI with pentapeptide repeats
MARAWMRIGAVWLLSQLGLAVVALGPTSAVAAPAMQVGGCVIIPGTQCPGANLSGANLSGADLRNANLRGADLRNANLSSANLQGADLRGANLSAVLADRANLSSVLLQQAIAHFARFRDANFNGSQLDLAQLGGIDAQHASMRHTNFAGSSLHFANLSHADLEGSNFHASTLHFTTLTGADIRSAGFVHASFGYTQMWHAAATKANLWPSNFDSDVLAVNALFERFNAHLDAYGSYGHCGPDSTFAPREWDGSRYLPVRGSCSAKAQPGGTHGFNATGPRTVSIIWDGTGNENQFELWGTNGVKLRGGASSNWGAFYVRSAEGLSVTATGTQAPGSPGGPLAQSIVNVCCALPGDNEYIIRTHGWLPRAPVAGLTYGPRPLAAAG